VTQGNLTVHDINLSNGTPQNSFACTNHLRDTYTYDTYGQPLTSDDPNANNGDATHTGCSVSGTLYTTCAAYDGAYHMLPVSATNALNQTTSVTYGAGQGFGYGLWPSSTTDANGQTTSVTYDALGRTTSVSAPGETAGSTTQTSYTFWCPAPSSSGGTVSPQTPCAEVDRTQRLDSTHPVTARSFYDGFGRLVETRTPGPNGQDVVQYASYDNQGHLTFTRQPYFVASYTGPAGAAAYATPDGNNTTRKIYTYPSRLQTTAKDALSNVSTSTASVVCAPVSGDSNCYAQGMSVDANGHQAASLGDALGRTVYTQTYTGNGTGSPAYTLYATVSQTYDLLGRIVKITQPNGTSADTFTYDPASRMTASADPDLGSFSYTYDSNSNITQQSDARGAA
jgi:YD repeat-containing protein